MSMLSSTALLPWMMVPSTGIRSPGRTTTVSPLWTSATGTSTSVPFRSTRAVAGWSEMRPRSAEAVLRLARDSRALPTRMSAMMMITAS